jgi:ribosomal protein S18 acetylase RimI-like enzyme
MNYQICKSEIDDAEDLLEIQKLAYQIEATRYNYYNFTSLNQTVEELKSLYKDHIILKVVLDGKIIGSVRAYEKNGTCYIGMLFVHPHYHNQGIGTALMKEIEKQFKAIRYELFVGAKSDNIIHLYKKLGYDIYRKDKYKGLDIEIFYMEKSNKNI